MRGSGALGMAILAAISLSRTSAVAGPGPPDAAALNEGFQAAFLAGAGMAAIGAIVALTVLRSADSRAAIGAGPALEPAG